MASLQWMNDALCTQVGSDVFFPENGENQQQAIQVCRRCPVQLDCLEYALNLDESGVWNVLGIWGGLTVKERRALLRERRTHRRVA